MMNWIKIMCNLLDNRKIKIIRREPEGNTLVLLWLLMLIEAGKCSRGGYLMISERTPYTDETLGMVTDIQLPIVQLGLAIFTRLEMIDQNDKAIFIRNWGKYQSEDKLEARRRKDRDRQRRHRAKEREKILALPDGKNVSRDSHTSMSRYVTQENRTEKNREEKTTTDQIRLLLAETPFALISDQELQALEKQYGTEHFLQAADIAAETWRRNREDMHNPGAYLNALCTSLVVPEWYIPRPDRLLAAKKARKRKKFREKEMAALKVREKKRKAASEALWTSLSDDQRERYLTQVRDNLPAGIELSKDVEMIMAKCLLAEGQLNNTVMNEERLQS